MTDFATLLRILADQDVAYILVGGAAATVHGSARLTLDIDVVYQRTPDNLARLVNALAPYAPGLRGAPAGLLFQRDVETLDHGLNFTLTTTLGAIDLLGGVALLRRRPRGLVRAACKGYLTRRRRGGEGGGGGSLTGGAVPSAYRWA